VKKQCVGTNVAHIKMSPPSTALESLLKDATPRYPRRCRKTTWGVQKRKSMTIRRLVRGHL
jgi:hypothetical protein